ncbi:MAG: MaoC family dehydratase [Reyranellaceae bacterium]
MPWAPAPSGRCSSPARPPTFPGRSKSACPCTGTTGSGCRHATARCRTISRRPSTGSRRCSAGLRCAAAREGAWPNSSFKPEEHRFGPTHWFEDLVLGQKFYINSRTQTEGLFAAFQLASGDDHPIHYDREYCRARGIAISWHTVCRSRSRAPPGGHLPARDRRLLIGFLEQSSRFLKPVYCGDTLYPLLEVSDLKPGRNTGVVTMKLTIHNQNGELVCDGEHKYLVKKRPQ